MTHFKKQKIVAREKETTLLQALLEEKKAQFIALYGRRRIGKTYLIEQFFQNKGVYFSLTGMYQADMVSQLENFQQKFSQQFPSSPLPLSKTLKSWRDAFECITAQIIQTPKNQYFILFFDELPWLAGRKSRFLHYLDYFWNTNWKNYTHLKLIVCGSAASWMLDKIIHSKGGLHNRITRKILLRPFSLRQTKEFLLYRNCRLTNSQVLDYYMIFGGVPYYLEFIQKNLSIDQNIQNILFDSDAPLQSEFPQIFKSLFNDSLGHIKIIEILSNKRSGLLRSEISTLCQIPSGGNLKKKLLELQAAGFINYYSPMGHHRKNKFYMLTDEFSLFYLKWVKEILDLGLDRPLNYWINTRNTPSWNSWAGYSFESICFKHSNQIISALNLDTIKVLPSTWRYKHKMKSNKISGAQIDLLLERSDNAITICEIKYSKNPYIMDKKSAISILNKIEVFKEVTQTKSQIFTVLITVEGVARSAWTKEVFDQVITLDQLFTK